MKLNVVFVSLIIVHLLSSPLKGQNIKFQNFLVEEGLSNNSVNKMANDSSGALWIATWDGLNFFDGQSFEVFRNNPEDSASLPGNYVSNLMTDESGNLWVSASNNSVSRMLEKGRFQNFVFENEVNVRGLNKEGNYLIAVAGVQYVFDPVIQGFKTCEKCAGGTNEKAGLYGLLERERPEVNILDVLTDDRGNIWYATLKNGLFVLPVDQIKNATPTFQQYLADPSNPYSLRSNEIYDLIEDVFGNIWLGLKDGGVSMAFKNSDRIFSVYSHPKKNPNLPNETIRAITQDSRNRIWLGYYNAGIFFNTKQDAVFREFEIKPPNNSDNWKRIRSLFTDSYGDVWVGTYGGIIRISEGKRPEFFTHSKHTFLTAHRNYDFYEDRENGELWVACWGGLARFNYSSQEFVPFEGSELLSDFHVRQVHKTGATIYLATEHNGLIKFSNGKIETIDSNRGLLDNSIYSIWEDKQSQNLWLGTLSGISIYHPVNGLVENLTRKNGLSSQFVYGLLANGNKVWASTTNGIAIIDKDNLRVTTLPWQQGWQGPEFSEGAFYQNNLGFLFFGGVNGLNYFHPQQLDIVEDLPLIYFQTPDNLAQLLKQGGAYVEVEVISFSENPNNKVVYRINNASDWHKLPENRVIKLDDLPPGSYVLEVKNTLSTNSADSKNFEFSIPRPFWRSAYFWVAVLLLFAAVVLIWRFRSIKAAQKRLEYKIEERTRLIEQQKARLEMVNQALDEKNQEILNQKTELLALHQRKKDGDFEMERFKSFFLDQFQGPLNDLKKGFDQLKVREKKEKRKLDFLLDSMLKELNDWNKAGELNQLHTPGKSITLLQDLLQNIEISLKTLLKKYGVQLETELTLNSEWVELDVFQYKLAVEYLFREMVKYLKEGSRVAMKIMHQQENLSFEILVSNKLFLSNFEEIWLFSPYINSCKKMLEDMQGKISFEKEESAVKITLDMPVTSLHSEPEKVNFRHWKHLELAGSLDPNKPTLLLFAQKYELDTLLNMIDDKRFNVIAEDDERMARSAMEQIRIDVVALYNLKIDNHFTEMVKGLKEHGHASIMYLHDGLGEKNNEWLLLDIGIDKLIELPVSRSYIIKQVVSLVEAKRNKPSEQHKLAALLVGNEQGSPLNPNEKLVQQGLQIIKENLDNPEFKVETLTELLELSKIKCYRVFKECLDTSPSDLIIHLRMQKAENLLQNKSFNIADVSYKCGYNDPKYFSKLFKKHFGVSPKSFRAG